MSALQELTVRWRGCSACKLRRTCKRVVVGEPWSSGDVSDAPVLLIVGEAPGRQEDDSGRPFVGEAGQILRDEILTAADVRLAYVTNSVGCRPPGNRDPEADELEACAPRLAELAGAIRPQGVLFVGRIAEEACAGAPWLRGIPSVGILHPAALLYRGWPNEATRKQLAAQVAKVKRLLVRAGAPAEGPGPKGRKAPREGAVVPSRGPAEACACDSLASGAWTSADGSEEPFSACSRCAAVKPAHSGRG